MKVPAARRTPPTPREAEAEPRVGEQEEPPGRAWPFCDSDLSLSFPFLALCSRPRSDTLAPMATSWGGRRVLALGEFLPLSTGEQLLLLGLSQQGEDS